MYTAISPLLFQYVYKLPSSFSTFSIWGNKYIYDQVQLDSYKLYIIPTVTSFSVFVLSSIIYHFSIKYMPRLPTASFTTCHSQTHNRVIE